MLKTQNRIRIFSAKGAFSLVELLVVLAIFAVLAGLGLAAWGSVRRAASATQCAQQMRSLGQAILQYTAEHQGQFPRSWHSAAAHREPGWAMSVAPYLGIEQAALENDWASVFNRRFRSPVDTNTDPFIYSYALNVHFELDPNGDDYVGSPQTWRRLAQVPHPGKTILLAQTRPVLFGDHLMCHQWSGTHAARNALNHDVHGGRANYLFVDGHVGKLGVGKTFSPAQGINRWNPALAGQ